MIASDGPVVALSRTDPATASCTCGWSAGGRDIVRLVENHADVCIEFVAHRFAMLDALSDLVGHVPAEVMDMLEALACEPGAGHRVGRHLANLLYPEDDDA